MRFATSDSYLLIQLQTPKTTDLSAYCHEWEEGLEEGMMEAFLRKGCDFWEDEATPGAAREEGWVFFSFQQIRVSPGGHVHSG